MRSFKNTRLSNHLIQNNHWPTVFSFFNINSDSVLSDQASNTPGIKKDLTRSRSISIQSEYSFSFQTFYLIKRNSFHNLFSSAAHNRIL